MTTGTVTAVPVIVDLLNGTQPPNHGQI